MGNNRITIEKKHKRLLEVLKNGGRALVAFSGGVDSTLLLKVASEALGEGVLAVTAVSATYARHEQEEAVNLARKLGVKHVMVASGEMDLPAFVLNTENKCYHCKKSRFSQLWELARVKGYNIVLDGTNADDHHDFRPGIHAALDLGVRSPLNEVGLTKSEIRLLSKKMDLPTWDKPSLACLATRIPSHTPITVERLKQIDNAETFIRGMGIARQIRVRHYGATARIELDKASLSNILGFGVREKVVGYLKTLGFQFVTLDLDGYRMGSLNHTDTISSDGEGNEQPSD